MRVPDASEVTQNSGEITERGKSENLRHWPKGVSGNPGGRPRTKLFRRYLIRELLALVEGEPDARRIQKGVRAIVTKMTEGDVRAFEAIRDTVDGKPSNDDTTQQTEVVVNLGFIE